MDDDNFKPVYFNTTGHTALAYKNKELIGHDKVYHAKGFGSPVGLLKGINLAIEDMSPTDLEAYGIYEGKIVELEFEGGIKVTGQIITGKRNLRGKIILISFKNCTVKHYDKVLFNPDWGIYDMAVGKEVISAYSGVADPENFGLTYEAPKEKTHKIIYSDSDRDLHKLYQEVRNIRENNDLNNDAIPTIFNTVSREYPNDWLLSLEIYELIYNQNSPLKERVLKHLENLAAKKEVTNLIKDGLKLLELEFKKI